MFSVQEVVVFGIAAGALGGAVLWTVAPWTRDARRFIVAAGATTAGFLARNLMLVGTNATGINVDLLPTPVSAQDLGSGDVAFAATSAALALNSPDEPAGRVVGAAGLAGLVAAAFDVFVL